MAITINPLGCSEAQLDAWRKKGFSYDKRTARQMILAFNKVPGATQESIDGFEKSLGIKLPDDYREFIYKYDGGVPDPAVFDINKERDSSVVKELFGLETPLTASSLKYNLSLYENRIPSKFIPIGSDVFGNKIILGVGGDNFGAIFFWDHENEASDEDVQTYHSNIFLISESFDDFLGKLRLPKE